jgi:DNA polymerase-1
MEDQKAPALYLLDVYAIIYRSYFAFLSRPLRNPEGKNVSAAFGFFRFLFSLFEQRKPKAFAAVFDPKGKTFRHQMYEAYKATRQKTPDDLIEQVPLVEEILHALKIPSLRQEGYEADDIIATLATSCREAGRECYVISGDKDLLQLVGGSVKALRPQEGFGFKELDSRAVEQEWGVGPERILDFLSLTGDSSDNVPGVRGIGDKTALKLLSSYRDVEDIYSHLDEIKPDSLRAKLEAGKADADLSKRLIRLSTKIDLGLQTLDELRLEAPDREAASPLFQREGMRSLLSESAPSKKEPISRSGAINSDVVKESGPSPIPSESPHEQETSIGSLFDSPLPQENDTASLTNSEEKSGGAVFEAIAVESEYRTITEEADLADLVDRCIKAEAFALDTETDDLDALTAKIVGFSISLVPGQAYYIPLRSPDSTTIKIEVAQRQLDRLLNSKSRIVGHNIKYDLHILKNLGLLVNNEIFDTMVAAWILDAESMSFSLESVAYRILGLSGLSYNEVVEKGLRFDSVPIDRATRYACEDADFTFRLYRRFKKEMANQGLEEIFYTMEMPLVPILAEMEGRGIVVNSQQLRSYGLELEKELGQIERQAWEMVGHEFNLASTKQLQEVLFTERKLPPRKKTKTGYSTDTSVLEELAPLDPVPQLILRQRLLAKLKNTYVDTLADLAEHSPASRVHTTYIQTGAATGRLSSKDPNLQNIPIRDEEGRRIRSAFTAAPGKLLISADYSQIELMVMAHLSQDANLLAAFKEGVDVHRRTASFIFAVDEKDVSAEQRRVAKTINFGVIYGMSAFRLARDLGIPNARAQSFIETYFGTYAGVAAFIQKTIAETEKTGYTTTLFGRRRHIQAINSRNKNERQAAQRVAVNTPIQGTAADIVKLAMLRVDKRLRREAPEVAMLLQVHDELLFEVPESSVEKASALIREEMEGAAKLAVPLKVSLEVSYSWGDMH